MAEIRRRSVNWLIPYIYNKNTALALKPSMEQISAPPT